MIRARAYRMPAGWRVPPRLTAMLGVCLLSALGACEHDTAVPAARSTTARTEHRGRPASLPAEPSVAPTARAWWNQPEWAESLSLTAEQRARMDALLTQALEKQRAAQQQQRDQQRALRDALDAGQWDVARQAAALVADGMAAAWRTQTLLKIDVFGVLDQAQQHRVLTEYRQLLRQTSVLARLRGGQRPRPAAGGTP